MSTINVANLSYQNVPSPLGGSYTEKKLAKLGLPPLAGSRFLDLGCNSGFYCVQADNQGASRVVGVDLDANVIRQARLACPKGEFFDGGWETLPNGPFDVVIILSAIHYARDPVHLVGQIHERLATGGLLVIEGGLIDPTGSSALDILVPGWRQVGDRCRHLSYGYLAEHVLTGFDWKVHGLSEPRGGDDVTRYVVHARKGTPRPRRDHHVIDLRAYFDGLARSAATIVKAQPAYAYVSQLPANAAVSEEQIGAVLNQPAWLAEFLTDLAFVLEPSANLPVHLQPTLPSPLLERVAAGLQKFGHQVTIR